MSNNIFSIIGDNSVYEFFLITVLSLVKNYDLLIVFIIGYLLNSKLNSNLEYFFKNDLNKIGITNFSGKLIDPSGHFQGMTFCFLYYILSHETGPTGETGATEPTEESHDTRESDDTRETINPYVLFLFLFIALCCLVNCIVFKYHTLLEIIIGIIFGILISYFYFLSITPFVVHFLRTHF